MAAAAADVEPPFESSSSSAAESSISCSGGRADGLASEGMPSSRVVVVEPARSLPTEEGAEGPLLLLLLLLPPYRRNASNERAQVMLQNRRCLV